MLGIGEFELWKFKLLEKVIHLLEHDPIKISQVKSEANSLSAEKGGKFLHVGSLKSKVIETPESEREGNRLET